MATRRQGGMAPPHMKTGRRAEALVADLLQDRGYRLLARNARVGRLELDLVARKGATLVVCEVRSRSSEALVSPAETIDRRKIGRLRRAAARWLETQDISGVEVRFDVAAVVFDGPGGRGRVEYYEDAF